MTGQGVMLHPDGSRYEGALSDGYYEGIGQATSWRYSYNSRPVPQS